MIEAAKTVRATMATVSAENSDSNLDLDRAALRKRQDDLLRRAQPIKTQRAALIRALSELDPSSSDLPTRENPLSIDTILATLDSHQRTTVQDALHNLREKMMTYRAMTLANQTVAIYAMDFYSAMLGQVPASDPYNASGEMIRQWTTATNVQRSC